MKKIYRKQKKAAKFTNFVAKMQTLYDTAVCDVLYYLIIEIFSVKRLCNVFIFNI